MLGLFLLILTYSGVNVSSVFAPVIIPDVVTGSGSLNILLIIVPVFRINLLLVIE